MDVQSVVSSKSVFCALRSDGHVVCWGDPQREGDKEMMEEPRCPSLLFFLIFLPRVLNQVQKFGGHFFGGILDMLASF